MNIVYMNPMDLIPYEKNAKKHNRTQVENVAESIKQFGWQQPIVVDKNNVIIIGHCRRAAAIILGLDSVPVVVASDLSDENVKKLRLIDNKSNESDWDYELLQDELTNLNVDDFIFDWGVTEEEHIEVEDDNFDVDEAISVIPMAKMGDIYQLGEHRLMCGDSTSLDDVQKLVDGEDMDLLYTDPPYNVNVSNADGLTIENDNITDPEFVKLLDAAFFNASQVLKPGGAFYCWHSDSESVNFRTLCEKNGLLVKQCLIWIKNSFNFGRQDYKWQHEPCLYGWKDGAGHYFVEEYNHSTCIDDTEKIDSMSKDELKETLKKLLSSIPSTAVHENKPVKNDLHPTMKPIKMCSDMIRHSSKIGEKVLDLFGGSGSTLICCEQLGRKCYMMEYDNVYVDVIIKRWETFTGLKAEKVN